MVLRKAAVILQERKRETLWEGDNCQVWEWRSMILTFLKNKDMIKAADGAKGVISVVSKQRPRIMDKVEKLLLIFIKEKEMAFFVFTLCFLNTRFSILYITLGM